MNIRVKFNEKGQLVLQEITRKNIDKIIAIIVNDELYSWPRVNEEISGGELSISGQFSVNEAKSLAKAFSIKSDVRLKWISTQS